MVVSTHIAVRYLHLCVESFGIQLMWVRRNYRTQSQLYLISDEANLRRKIAGMGHVQWEYNRESKEPGRSTFLGSRVSRGMTCDERRLGPEGERGKGLPGAAKFRQHPVTSYT